MLVNTKLLIISVSLVLATIVQAIPAPVLDIRQWDFQPSVPTNPEGAPLLPPSPGTTTATTATTSSTTSAVSMATSSGTTNGPAVTNNGTVADVSDGGATAGNYGGKPGGGQK